MYITDTRAHGYLTFRGPFQMNVVQCTSVCPRAFVYQGDFSTIYYITCFHGNIWIKYCSTLNRQFQGHLAGLNLTTAMHN